MDYKDYPQNSAFDENMIKKVRKLHNLPLYEKKNLSCLKCSQFFESFDKKLNRLCPDCLEKSKNTDLDWDW